MTEREAFEKWARAKNYNVFRTSEYAFGDTEAMYQCWLAATAHNEPHIAKLESDLSEAKGIIASLARDLQVEKIKREEDNARMMRLVEAVEAYGNKMLLDNPDGVWGMFTDMLTLAAEIKAEKDQQP